MRWRLIAYLTGLVVQSKIGGSLIPQGMGMVGDSKSITEDKSKIKIYAIGMQSVKLRNPDSVGMANLIISLHSCLRYEIRGTPIRDALGGATRNERIIRQLSKVFYKSHFFMQNKAKFKKSQVSASSYITKEYGEKSNWTLGKNEPKQSQFQVSCQSSSGGQKKRKNPGTWPGDKRGKRSAFLVLKTRIGKKSILVVLGICDSVINVCDF